MIKNLSPYYVEIPLIAPLSGLVCEEFTMELYVWNGLKSTPPTTPLYQFTKQNPTGSSGSELIDVSNLISDAIIFTQQEGNTTELINGNNQVWVKWQTYYKTTDPNDAIDESNINTQLSVKGYAYGMDGMNQSIPINKILLTGTDFKVNTDSVFVLPIEIDETIPPPASFILNSVTFDSVGVYNYNYTLNFDAIPVKTRYRQTGDTLWIGAEPINPPLNGSIGTHDELVSIPITGSVDFRIEGYDGIANQVIFSNVITQII